MSATNRAQIINKLYKVAKKKFTPVTPISSRTVLDHMLYGCCLENSRFVAADEAFARLQENFFDWNEVRVTTTKELAESLKSLAHPDEAALSIKKTLHGVFETFYKFDIDFLRKENLRKTVQQFEKFRGVRPFVVSYAAQVALDGQFITLDEATLMLMYVLGIVTEAEVAKGRVPGLERTIPKNKGIEFSSVVHQLASEFFKAPHSKDVRAVVLSIASDAKDRFPKRGGRKKKEPEVVEKPQAAATKVGAKATGKPDPKKPAKKAPAKKAPAKKPPVKKAAKKKASKKQAPKKAKTRSAKAPTRKFAKKGSTTKKAAKKKSIVRKAGRPKKKSPTRTLSRKKPR